MLIAYTVALDLIRALRPVVEQLRGYSSDAACQVERAGTSIVLNLAEGERRYGRDPRRFYAMAYGSAGEIRGALLAAQAWGWPIHCDEALAVLDRELGLLYGLTRRSKDDKMQPSKPGVQRRRPPSSPRTVRDAAQVSVSPSPPPQSTAQADQYAVKEPDRLHSIPRANSQ